MYPHLRISDTAKEIGLDEKFYYGLAENFLPTSLRLASTLIQFTSPSHPRIEMHFTDNATIDLFTPDQKLHLTRLALSEHDGANGFTQTYLQEACQVLTLLAYEFEFNLQENCVTVISPFA